MKLIVQPDAGIAPIVNAIKQAKRSINVLIFRLDRAEIAHALEGRRRARGARSSADGARQPRRHEEPAKAGNAVPRRGITVSRTADDLVRYHGKMMILDDKILHVYGFNFIGLDMLKSRSFGVITKNDKLVNEANKLFMADFDRLTYSPGYERLVVSPENARERLGRFISGARKQLLIYDPQVSDDAMLRLISERIKAGVDVRILGRVEAKWNVKSEKFPGRRLHVRTIIRDGKRAFVGSQSLRRLELDKRREVGVIVTDVSVVEQLQEVFEKDWAQTESGRKSQKKAEKAEKAEKKELKLKLVKAS
jgi:phosphatidylserine/phosphatidylglycerophosphate/cardiolipin synthase-like enzyme